MVGSIRGVVGQIRWSYYIAATINNYTVTRADDHWTLVATVVLSDAFKLSQQPLIFVAPHAKGEWRWPILSCALQNGALSARLGQMEL